MLCSVQFFCSKKRLRCDFDLFLQERPFPGEDRLLPFPRNRHPYDDYPEYPPYPRDERFPDRFVILFFSQGSHGIEKPGKSRELAMVFFPCLEIWYFLRKSGNFMKSLEKVWNLWGK